MKQNAKVTTSEELEREISHLDEKTKRDLMDKFGCKIPRHKRKEGLSVHDYCDSWSEWNN